MADTLLQALVNIQAQAPKVQRDGFNPYTESKFMELRDVLAVVVPMLNDEGLLWQVRPSMDAQGRPSLKYSLTHVATKEAIEDEMQLMLLKSAPQDMGSAITYARRYALVCVLNLVADRDDDGRGAQEAATTLPQTDAPAPEVQQAATLSPDQQKDIRQTITDLANELKKDFPEAWEQTTAWAKQREIDLTSPPADKLRAVERALRRKLEGEKAKAKKPAARKRGQKADETPDTPDA